MVELEKATAERKRRANLKKMVLEAVSLVGLISIAVVAPNVLGALAKLGFIPHNRQEESIQRTRKRLEKQGLLKREGARLRLTPRGEKALRHLSLIEYEIPKPLRWDGEWRVLIFDIPERKRKIRSDIRNMLARLGFVRLQDSVWVYPYNCEEAITLLKADFKLGYELLYMIVDSIEGDWKLKREFGLK